MSDVPIHILGAGLAGLSTAIEYGDSARVIEAEDRPGGLVKSHRIDVLEYGSFWFDHVLHLLYFSDSDVEQKVLSLGGEYLVPCPPIALVETLSGTTRYPVQMHLADLSHDVRIRCLLDLIDCQPIDGYVPANLEESLLFTFGRGLCETFLFPYNRKAWGRPLNTLRAELAWTVTRPDLAKVLRGAMSDGSAFCGYNSAGWYPRPPDDWPLRGMEVLSVALAKAVPQLRLRTSVIGIDPERKEVCLRGPAGSYVEAYQTCVATIPLPRLLETIAGVPTSLLNASRGLKRNRVWSVALCLVERPFKELCHWRYYADESVCFTRLVDMTAFDPRAVPDGCGGLLAEIQEPGENMPLTDLQLIDRVVDDAVRVGAIDNRGQVLAAEAWCVDPAYVVFEDNTADVVECARRWLEECGIHLLGRYGRWEYSSMAQVMRDGFAMGRHLRSER